MPTRNSGGSRGQRAFDVRTLATTSWLAIRDGVASGDFTAREVAEAFNAAVAAAARSTPSSSPRPKRRSKLPMRSMPTAPRARAGQMAGVPIGMKDLFCTQGVQTTAASHILEGFVPQYESTVSANLWEAGAGMLGKLNLDQFAMGSSNETSYFGNVTSPWRERRLQHAMTPGGSSGGQLRRGRGAARARRHRHRYRRLDPPACRLHRHCRRQADLWPLQPLGRGGVCQQPRSGGPDGAQTSKIARSCSARWRVSIPRIRPASICPCPIGQRRSMRSEGQESRHSRANTGWKAPIRKSSTAGSTGLHG